MPVQLVVSAPPVEGLDLLALVASLQCSVRPAPKYAFLELTIELDHQRPEPSSRPDELGRRHHRPVRGPAYCPVYIQWVASGRPAEIGSSLQRRILEQTSCP